MGIKGGGEKGRRSRILALLILSLLLFNTLIFSFYFINSSFSEIKSDNLSLKKAFYDGKVYVIDDYENNSIADSYFSASYKNNSLKYEAGESSGSVCGNRIVEIGEECDDGDDGNDCCNNKCKNMCEDGGGSGGGSGGGDNNEDGNEDDCDTGIGSPDKECKCFGFDFGVSKWECDGKWTERETIYSGTSVTGNCDSANWDVKNSSADGIVVKAGNIEHGGYHYAINGTNGTLNLSKDLSHITFCGYNVTEYCGDEIINGNEECDLGSDNGKECTPPYNGSCAYCSDICENITLTDGFCGDNVINGNEECEPPDTETCDENCRLKKECYDDNDCPDDTNSTNYCFDNDVYYNFIDYFCLSSSCDFEINKILKQDCGEDEYEEEYHCYNDDVWKNISIISRGCENGECFINNNFQTEKQEDCGEDYCNVWSEYYCVGKNKTRERTCYEKGCDDGSCFNNSYTEKQSDECLYGCMDGNCIEQRCGNGIKEGNEQCDDGNLDNYDSCRNDCTLPYCGDLILDPNEQCEISDQCPEKCTQYSHKLYTVVECNSCLCDYSKYKCVIWKCGAVCDSNDDCTCQQDYCNGTTLYDYFNYSSCGTTGAEGCLCSECIPTLIYNSTECGYVEEYCGDSIVNDDEKCDDGILNGIPCEPPYNRSCSYCSANCTNITLINGYCGDDVWQEQYEQCEENEDCDDQNENTIDTCLGNCTCKHGPITCNDNSDCGEDGWQENPFCKCSSKVFDTWINYTCVNPGTPQAYCINSSEIKLKEDCGNDTYSGKYCYNDDIYKNLTDNYCKSGNCFVNITEIFVKDCGEDYCGNWGDYYCAGKNKTIERTCYDKGCLSGSCFNNSYTEKQSDECLYGCMDGNCIEQRCGNGKKEGNEECDDGNLNNYDGCRNDCTLPYCGDGDLDLGEECDDGNNVNGDGCSADCEIEGCPDKDFDCVCDQNDWCLNSRLGEPVDEHGCDQFQFCGKLSCGEGCYKLDFIPKYEYPNCNESINSSPEGQYPGDCTFVMISKEGQLQPRCFPTTCAD